jgi:hypothetical protein
MNWMQSRTPEERKAIAAKSVATRQRNIQEREAQKLADIERRDSLKCEIKELENRLNGLEKIKLVNKTALTLTNKTLLSETDIVSAANTWELATGVYFLIDSGRVVYVGQSVNVYARIASHHDKVFDSFAFIPCCKEMLNNLESLYIHILRPALNSNHQRGVKYAPMSLDQLIGATA